MDKNRLKDGFQSLTHVLIGRGLLLLVLLANATVAVAGRALDSGEKPSVSEQVRRARISPEDETAALAHELYTSEVTYGYGAVERTTAPEPIAESKICLFDSQDQFLFKAGEWCLDVSFAAAKTTRSSDGGGNEKAGSGFSLAVTYYPKRWLGIGVEGSCLSGFVYDGEAAALAYLRIPCDSCAFSLQVFAGFGSNFESGNASANFHIGAGIEFRLLKHWGIFVDVRDVESFGGTSYYTAHAGLRYVF